MTKLFRPTLQAAIALLEEGDLPTADLTESTMANFLATGSAGLLSGVIGLEVHQPYGLLRSLAVSSGAQNRGLGKALVSAIEQLALASNLTAIYLLTTTADEYFTSMNYSSVAREEVPQIIQDTTEFSSLCPDDAVVMTKSLAT